MADATPSPVKAVRQFEEDEAIARRMQQAFDDEVHAERAQQIAHIEDEFDAATERFNEERNQRTLMRMGATTQ